MLIVLAILLALGVWWWRRGAGPDSTAISEPPRPALAPARAESSAPAPVATPAAPTPSAAPAAAAAPGALADEHADAGEDALRPSHPITPRHVRMQRENNLIGQMNGALDVSDGPGLRHLVDQYRSEFPEDPNGLQEGYGIIANCLEHPGIASKAAGQEYFERERGSILRRFVARHCQLQVP